jgi:hypothetical protein
VRIGILIPDGVGVRNFLLGRLLRILPAGVDSVVFHTVSEDILPRVSGGLNGQVQLKSLLDYKPNRFVLTLQYSLGYAQMYWANTMAMRRILQAPVPGNWRLRILHQISKTVGKLCGSPSRMRWLESLHCSAAADLPEVKQYEKLFEELKPSVVLSTNQRPSQILPAILAARKAGIPTATFIFSWDNLSSKGRIISPFDHYLVWSEHMAQELQQYYPDISRDRIHLVGTPQFEPYADQSILWSKEQFFAKIGADTTRPLICYSGGDASTCPEDQEHVRVLMELIKSGKIKGNPQVIVRPVPVDDGKRYQKVRDLFPELIFSQPNWVHPAKGDWSKVVPLADDIQFLANLTHHCDMNINLGSTMTLDFGLHDKPVVNVAFDVADPPIFGMPVWDYYYFFEHYRPVVELGAAKPARSPEQLAEFVNRYLDNPALDREGRQKLVDMQVRLPLDQSSQRILETLQSVGK